MLKRISFLLTVAALGGTVMCAQQSNLNLTVQRTNADNGKQMFVNYCAPCHGVDGRGNGPMVAALRTTPVDLTVLSRNHQGEFPAKHLIAVLQFGVETSAHGSKAMPVWGPTFNGMDKDRELTSLRISNIVHYVQTLQAK